MKMAANKNKYLQKTFPKENPRVINNSLDRAFKIDPEELANHQQLGVSLKSKNGAKLKKKDEKIAFGYWGIPILV